MTVAIRDKSSEFGGLATLPARFLYLLHARHALLDRPANDERFRRRVFGLLGSFKTNCHFRGLAATGIILSAVYMLWMYQRVVFGEVTNPKNRCWSISDFEKNSFSCRSL